MDPWNQFANEIGAEFIEGGFFSHSRVQALIKDWTVTLYTELMGGGGV